MTAEELTNQVLEMRNVAASLDIWLTFEVLENGELGECSFPLDLCERGGLKKYFSFTALLPVAYLVNHLYPTFFI